ncbi:hypothetical protein C8Q72DRAFT_309171 [Fomitopsis betulina]|nr:hypothetical protein C8Q72DRAFT_309171 [Fomitopsis betulina]
MSKILSILLQTLIAAAIDAREMTGCNRPRCGSRDGVLILSHPCCTDKSFRRYADFCSQHERGRYVGYILGKSR